MPRDRRKEGHQLRPTLEEALATLRRSGRPVLVGQRGRAVAALVSLEDLREHLAATPELSVTHGPAVEPADSPTRTLEALRELHDLSVASD